MAPPSRARSGASRLDLIAATWGGLLASVGLMIGGGRDWPLRLAVTAVAFLAGGFLASARSQRGVLVPALACVVAGYAIHAAFVALASVIDRAGGPSAPELVPDENGQDWLIVAGWAVGFAAVGALSARLLTRPPRRRSRFGSR